MARGRGIPSRHPTDEAARGRGRGRGRGRAPTVTPPPQHYTGASSAQAPLPAFQDHPIRPLPLRDEASPSAPYVHGSPYHVHGTSPAGISSSSSSLQHSSHSVGHVRSPEITGQFRTPSPAIPVPSHPQEAVDMHEDDDEEEDDPQQQPQQGGQKPFLALKPPYFTE